MRRTRANIKKKKKESKSIHFSLLHTFVGVYEVRKVCKYCIDCMFGVSWFDLRTLLSDDTKNLAINAGQFFGYKCIYDAKIRTDILGEHNTTFNTAVDRRFKRETVRNESRGGRGGGVEKLHNVFMIITF